MWEWVFGYDAEDIFVENPEDEEHYYKHFFQKDYEDLANSQSEFFQVAFDESIQAVTLDPLQSHKYTLIFIHGLGGHANDLKDMFLQSNLRDTRIILP